MPLPANLEQIFAALNTSHWTQLYKVMPKIYNRPDFEEVVLPAFLQNFRKFKSWQSRKYILHIALNHARKSDVPFELALLGLSDRSWIVRTEACMVLAYSLRKDAIPHLRLVMGAKDPRVVEQARRAIHAIEMQNHDLFLDPSGKWSWIV